ncbi:alpha/beta hydrolase family protein [Breznakiella homolactica]|uniref:Alpha/beta fold hydrolase n=1 Tax=Breznakiella homolactica TaxID=2798577 RepID=A0A7T7XMN7_9SPIR|nr:alpha/beta fold hydrolase [Breznakiella homolactica]QQO09164.1 alpha/beta fold hydrolase [Breznakiella homolactica]
MNRIFKSAAVLLALWVLFSCASTGETKPGQTQIDTVTLSIPSARNTEIPGVFTIPAGKAGDTYPVVILAHGHGGSKDEAGMFTILAEALAENGIASLRIDFPGCGDSTEDFTRNNRLSYMLADMRSAKEYLKGRPEADMNRLGLLGYSMGGRIAALIAADDPDYGSVVFWSPAITPGPSDMYTFMQLENDQQFNDLHIRARQTGSATYTAVYGFEQTLGIGWFNDMVNFNPQDKFPLYRGAVLLITGSEDIIIPPARAEAILKAAGGARLVRQHEVQGADHGYGVYSGEADITGEAVAETVGFFRETL